MKYAPDAISVQRIQKLHPILKNEALQIALSLWDSGVHMRVTHTLRSWEEQNSLYAIGRRTPGKVVTNAKAGQSYHNYGLALDFCIIDDKGRASWSRGDDFNGDAMPDWMQVVDAFKAKGWEWGGDWKSFKDYPHLQKTFGQPIGNLMARSSNGIILYPQLA